MEKIAKKLIAPLWCLVATLAVRKMFPNSPPSDVLYSTIFLWLIWLAIRWRMREKAKQLEAAAQLLRGSDVSMLSPLAYEEYCVVLLRDAGWQASTTPRQDQGVDVIAVMRGVKVVIQCKMYRNPVGNHAVQEVIAGRVYYRAQLAVVVSTAPYTRSAYVLASRTQVFLLHHDQLPMLAMLAKIR